MTPGFHSDLDEKTYHAHRGSLSVSGAKTILKAPALFKWHLDNGGRPSRDVFDFGSAAHALVLGAGIENIYVAPFDNWQTKAAQAEKRIAHQEGLSPVLPADWLIVCDMAEALSRHKLAASLLTGGQPEVSAFAPDEATGVLRRCRYDYLRDDLALDYKSHPTAEPGAFARDAAKFGYHMQHAWYADVAESLGHQLRGFVFVVQAKEAPYLVNVVELDTYSVDRGRDLNIRALERYRDCIEVGIWPGHTPDTQVTPISLPRWAFYDQETA